MISAMCCGAASSSLLRRACFGWAATFTLGLAALPATTAADTLTLRLRDWAATPFTGDLTNTGTSLSGNPTYMSRVNFLREEPGATGRMWVVDLNGHLHIFQKSGTFASRTAELLAQARARAPYLDFNGQSSTGTSSERTNVPNAAGTSTTQAQPNGLFRNLTKGSGYANGFVTFEFDPTYPASGKFYTVHVERLSSNGDGSRLPVTTKYPGFNTTGYTSTNTVNPSPTPSGSGARQAVLIEWTDSNPANTTFEGTARELLRVGYNGSIHPMGDLTFDPTAQPGDPEWGVLYVASGDGGSGESNSNDDGSSGVTGGDRHFIPQRLDNLTGKILRLIPDLTLHAATSTVSPNGRYRIPHDNPFTDTTTYPGARREIYTYGHRNPHRFAWLVPPGAPATRRLLVTEIGLHAWEEVNFLTAGANYGYASREGPEQLTISTNPALQRTLGPVPTPDTLPLRLGATASATTVTPVYPVIAYPHTAPYGDAISSGFFYRGTAIPDLVGKFIFGDITTGKLFYCEPADMLAADDGVPTTLAPIHSIELRWDDPNDAPDAGEQTFARTFEIIEEGYHFRGGTDGNLPGGSTISGNGRADIRLAVDAAGELYLTSKSDGLIRTFETTLSPKQQWLWQHFSAAQRADAAISGDAADSEGDGLTNDLEYALALDPWADSSGAVPRAERVGDTLRLAFTPLRAELAYTVEASTDLVAWSDAGVTLTPEGDQLIGTASTVGVPRLFLRIAVEPLAAP